MSDYNKILTIVMAPFLVIVLIFPIIINLKNSGKIYECGKVMTSDAATADIEIQKRYTDWKNKFIESSNEGYSRIFRPESNRDTVSEGIGYGMIISAYMEDKELFDALWKYAKMHLNANGLMSWHIDVNNNILDVNAATDADEDLAFALIIADEKWGGYSSDASNLIHNIMEHEVESSTYVIKPGDSWGGSNITNPSYFAPAYYKVFKEYTGDMRWGLVVDKTYQIIAAIDSKTGAGTTGLLPDWTSAAGDPVAGQEYNYTYDATRVPWRLAKDAAWFCDPRADLQLSKLNAFFNEIGAQNIVDGYMLDGVPIGKSHNAAFVAPAATSAIVSTDLTYRAKMWNETVAVAGDNYYNESLRLLSLLLMSGHMPYRVEHVK